MNKKVLIFLSLILSLILTTCNGALGGVVEETTILTDTYPGALSVQAQLIIGTFELEETDLAVSVTQASELIPLWHVVRNLSESGTAADAEYSAIIGQIQETMTTEQLQTIATMELTQEDVFSLVQELGLLVNPGGNPSDNPDFVPPEGGFPEGMPEGAPEGFGKDLSPEEMATLQSERGENANVEDRMIQFLIDPLLELLES